MSRWAVTVPAAFVAAGLSPLLVVASTLAGMVDQPLLHAWLFDVPQRVCQLLLGTRKPSPVEWFAVAAVQNMAVLACIAPLGTRRRPRTSAMEARAFEAAVTQFHAD